MSSSSIARQNRRMRQKQMMPSLFAGTSELHALSSSSTSVPSVINSELYKNSLDTKSEKSVDGIINETESKADDSMNQGHLPASTGCSFIKCDVSSRPVGKIFVEDERGFRAIDASNLFQTFDNDCLQQNLTKTELAIDLACKSARYFHNFSFFCHGILGGISAIEILLLIHLISLPTMEEETLRHFSFLSQPVHNLFNFFCIICCISAFDRYDVGDVKQLFKYMKKCKLKIVVIFIYPVCLLLSLSTANVDEKLCLPEKNATIWGSFQLEGADNELFYWKTLSISKCAGALLAWIILSLEPNHNLFLQQLKNVLQQNKINAK